MTLVGTLHANKKEIPNDMKDKQTRKQGSSAFLYTKEMMLVSYVANTSSTKKKLVLLLSSQHTQPTIGSTGKLEVIEFYNSTKGGTDTFDQMCSVTSCSRKTKCWPLCIMYGLVNAANVSSYIIYRRICRRKGTGHGTQ
ncbi:piggyBac transposable element-derived protein 4-like [Macrobrachium rosenbergii]|uniref:piggyBac transposable element-derived protein 4-like n=1 Tax=Macrobrachium rosenbergii TaxID=79674 RepID=UPI0034D73EFF